MQVEPGRRMQMEGIARHAAVDTPTAALGCRCASLPRAECPARVWLCRLDGIAPTPSSKTPRTPLSGQT
jgi:hypothetical protein